jgi:hypothetical protein
LDKLKCLVVLVFKLVTALLVVHSTRDFVHVLGTGVINSLSFYLRLDARTFFFLAASLPMLLNQEQRNQEATCYVGDLDVKVDESLLWELMLQAGPVSMH